MSYVIHRQTFEYREGANTPDFDSKDWIILFEKPVFPKCESKYWKDGGNKVIEMNAEEKAVRDAEIRSAERWLPKDKMELLNAIWASYSGEDLMRIVGVLNDNAVFGYFLEDYSYTTARAYLTDLVSKGSITQSDCDLIDTILPLGGQ